MKNDLVFLFDVDNTLLDNDRVTQDLAKYLEREIGGSKASRYWALFEKLRAELGYADYLGALQRYRVENPREPRLLAMSSFLINYSFADRLFPGALAAVAHVQRWGPAVILSDGDVVFQPRKVDRAGSRKRCAATCSFTCTRSRSSRTSRRAFPPAATSSSTTKSASSTP
jgi:FMN phosphatase YigB (HAD superfamily)